MQVSDGRAAEFSARRHHAPAALLTVALVVGLAGGAVAQLATIGVGKNAVGLLLVTRSDGKQERLQGKGALPLYEGDELRTGPGSQALIELHDGTRIALNEQTTFFLRSRQQKEAGIVRVIRVLLGEIWLKTPAGPRPIEVETPVANAAIRGTEFNLKVLEDGQSLLTVVEGLVEFGTPFGTCPIRAGTRSVGERGKRCTRPAPTDVQPVVGWKDTLLQ